MLAVVLATCAGCGRQSEKISTVTETTLPLVDGYPPPVDPVLRPRRATMPPIPPKIIVNGETSTLIYTCRNTQCDVLLEAVESFMSPEGNIEASPLLNKLLVSDSNDNVKALLRILEELDRPLPQVLIEARVVEIALDKDEEFEIRHLFRHTRGGGGSGSFTQNSEAMLNTPGSSPSVTQGLRLLTRSVTGDFNLDHFVRLLVTKGNARILSSPNLIVAAGQRASLITGEEVPIQSATVVSGSVSTTTEFKRVGIILHVTPTQVTSDTARLEINPEVSTVTGFTSAGESGISNPIVAVRNVRTTLTVKDGELITIGGLLRSEDRKVVRKVPGFGDIPGLGKAFQSTRNESVRTMLVFFLRLTHLMEGKPHTIRMHTPGAGLHRVDDAVEGSLPDWGNKLGDQEPQHVPAAGEVVDPNGVEHLKPIIVDMTPPRAEPPEAGAPEAEPGEE